MKGATYNIADVWSFLKRKGFTIESTLWMYEFGLSGQVEEVELRNWFEVNLPLGKSGQLFTLMQCECIGYLHLDNGVFCE